jgi:hypothetical protein
MNPDQFGQMHVVPPIKPPTPTANPATKQDSEKIIRTYESDVAHAVERKRASVMTIALAENMDKNGNSSIGTNDTSHHYGKKIAFMFFSLALLVGGVGGGYYLYLQSPLSKKSPETTIPAMVVGIITPEFQKTIDITNLKPTAIVSSAHTLSDAAKLQEGNIIEFLIGKQTTDQKGQKGLIRVGGSDILDVFDFGAPDMLKRSLTDMFMFGIYADTDGKKDFVILTTDFFQNAYTAMIRWEPTMVADIASFFGYAPNQLIDSVTGLPEGGVWKDAQIRNKDVRVYTNSSGQTILLYSFVDKNTLIITRSENALREIVTRIEKRAYVR